MGNGQGSGPGDDNGLNPKAWADINEAVGEALGVTPPDPGQDRVAGAPPHGASGAKLVQGTGTGDPVGAQEKVEENGIRYQMAGVVDLQEARRLQLMEAVEQENKKRLAQAMRLFHQDGSLLGEYAPMQEQATTPDTVDALWWLSLPRAQAMWELGIDKNDDATYTRVRRDIEAMAAIVINRMLQTRVVVPMVIRRKRRRETAQLFQGGQLKRLKPVNPDDYPGMGTSKRNRKPKST
jgi:hypothetical protein